MNTEINVKNEVENAQSFILGGKSEFSIENLNTQKVYRYKVRQCKDNNSLFFVRVLFKDKWLYAGYVSTEGKGSYNKGQRGSYDETSEPIKGLIYALRKGNNPLPRPMVMFHHGRCACCGKKLMDLESTQRGFGPKCWKRLFGDVR